MTDQEKQALENEELEVTELDDSDLEDVDGGGNGACPSANVGVCGDSAATLSN